MLASIAVACAIASLAAVPSVLRAAVPPNRSDPCASAGRDSCGTTGVGFYKVYRYGVRWFGDFRRAVPGEAHTFCLDLGYWYASAAYGYRPVPAGSLRATDGRAVPAAKQARIAYAIWEYGRSTRPRQQAAVMLYVHTMMGDGRPGELNPVALGRPVVVLYRRIAGAATRFRGPYRVEARLSDRLTVGKQANATIRVLSAEGNALRYARLTLSAEGADLPTRQVRTDGSGVVVASLTPTALDVRLRVATEALPSSRPRVFVPTSAAARTNGQRLAAPTSGRVSLTVSGRARPVVTTTVSLQTVRPGSSIFDRISVDGLDGAPGQVDLELFGPFPSRGKISCARRPYWSDRLAITSDGEVSSPPVKVARAGFYTYRARLVATPAIPASATGCTLASSTSLAVPKIVAGRGDLAARVRVAGVGGRTPVRVSIRSLGISAPVVPVGIDIARGVLGLPSSIARASWWRDGAAPGARSGAILIAGHVDSADAGAGAFFKLHRARAHALVRIATAGGVTYAYRVVSVRTYRKGALPTSVYSTNGPARLVLVTCGGRFDAASGHYVDNVVLTAVPS